MKLYMPLLKHILLLSADDEDVLDTMDLEWCAENLTVPPSSIECTELPKEAQQASKSLGQSKVTSKPQKVCYLPFVLISFFCFRV